MDKNFLYPRLGITRVILTYKKYNNNNVAKINLGATGFTDSF
jgi:hypothetical protein